MNNGNNGVPFKVAAARHRQSLVKTVTWATGQRQSLGLDNIGYLNGGQIVADLTVTVGTTGTVSDAAAAASNFFPYIGLRSPQGEQIWSTSSRDVFDLNYRLDRSVTPASDSQYATWAPGTAGAQTVHFRLRIPVALNDNRNFDFGMLMRQINNNQFYLDVQQANFSDLVGSGSCIISSITGSWSWEETYYDAVQQGSGVIPPNFAQYVRLRSITAPQALANGQNDVSYATGPVIVDAFHRLINNGAADGVITNLSYIETKANKGNQIEYRTGSRLAYDNQMHLGKALRAGVYHLDFCDDLGAVNETSARDFINSNMATQLDFFVQYGGAPGGTSQIQSIYREIVTLAA